MRILIDSSLIIKQANETLRAVEKDCLEKLLRLSRSNNFALDIYANSVNKKEVIFTKKERK